jgi:hypothetical protein
MSIVLADLDPDSETTTDRLNRPRSRDFVIKHGFHKFTRIVLNAVLRERRTSGFEDWPFDLGDWELEVLWTLNIDLSRDSF